MKISKLILAAGLLLLSACSPYHEPSEALPPPGDLSNSEVRFAAVQTQVVTRCTGCHRPGSGLFDMTSLEAVMARPGFVIPGSPELSRFVTVLGGGTMPPSGPLSEALQNLVVQWIQQGAQP